MKILEHLGNLAHLNIPKTAFLCSRQVPATTVLKCYDWAIAQRQACNCVISGFHSQIEKDVLHYLINGTQPIIIVLARGLKINIEPQFEKPLEQGRLLIITPFKKSITHVTKQTATIRNKLMLALTDNIMVGYKKAGGSLEKLLSSHLKPIAYLDS